MDLFFVFNFLFYVLLNKQDFYKPGPTAFIKKSRLDINTQH